MPPPPMIAGLFPYLRGGVHQEPDRTLREIPLSLRANPAYRERLVVLAGDAASAQALEGFGLHVRRVFADAPAAVRRDSAHKMKHWMCLWALREFGEFLWIDWDTVWLRDPDESYWEVLRANGTPRFIRIPDYWATVNCGIYYAPASWSGAMERALDAEVAEPNDELLWRSVLPADVLSRDEFWWGDSVVHVQKERHTGLVTPRTFAVHVGDLAFADLVRERSRRAADGRGAGR